MPFHNIFSKLKSKKKKNKSKKVPIIIADVHEKNSLVISELQANKQINLEVKSLKIGDYMIGKTIIERKTVQDFISSMLNKRLFIQLKQMQKYNQQILILEGDLQSAFIKKTKLNPNSIRGFILSILTSNQIPIIMTSDYEDTANYLIILAKQQLKPKTDFTFHKRIPRTIKEQKNYILESFQGIGPATAKKLLKRFKTIKNIINAQPEQLKELIGKKSEIFKILD
jgi:Fanconi anemia group M protein|tara:strand:+ start:306 stop:983 length:678 start_codon:yes stop_codon:yes gene_type:complete